MRIPSEKRRGRLEMNMTPMIDVVFLLIIFFLVSSHLAKQEAHAELDLPLAQTGEENRETKQRRLTINVSQKGGVPIIAFGARVVENNKLYNQLKREMERATGGLEVRIRADRAVPYGVIEPLLVNCAELKIWNVQFAVISRGETGDKSL